MDVDSDVVAGAPSAPTINDSLLAADWLKEDEHILQDKLIPRLDPDETTSFQLVIFAVQSVLEARKILPTDWSPPPATLQDCKELLEKNEDLLRIVQEAVKLHSFKHVRCLRAFFPTPEPHIITPRLFLGMFRKQRDSTPPVREEGLIGKAGLLCPFFLSVGH
jgi:hypothetical protein